VGFEILREVTTTMITLYVLQNQHGYFLQKTIADKTAKIRYVWSDGQELNKIFRTIHKDEAINMMFESGFHNVELRINIREYPASGKGLPAIPAEDMPEPLPDPVIETDKDERSGASAETAIGEAPLSG